MICNYYIRKFGFLLYNNEDQNFLKQFGNNHQLYHCYAHLNKKNKQIHNQFLNKTIKLHKCSQAT